MIPLSRRSPRWSALASLLTLLALEAGCSDSSSPATSAGGQPAASGGGGAGAAASSGAGGVAAGGSSAGSSGAGGAAAGSAGGVPITHLAPMTYTASTPITAPQKTWTWVPIDGAICRDGSATGVGVYLDDSTDKVMIFLEGGGACFNALTCLSNPSSFGESDFLGFTGAVLSPTTGDAEDQAAGLLSRAATANPTLGWSVIYVPYCTGDVHAGNSLDTTVDGVSGTQQFAGYTNLGKVLSHVVPTFPSASQVLLTGVSAGGFGAALNYDQVARAFGSVPITLLDDSGPPMSSTYVAPCLTALWQSLWGIDSTVLADCGTNCNDLSTFTTDYFKSIESAYAQAPLALLETTDDTTIRTFFGFGGGDCMALLPLDGPTFTQGLLEIRTDLAAPNFGTFYFQSDVHTVLESSAFYTRAVGSSTLVDYVAALLTGQVSNVGP